MRAVGLSIRASRAWVKPEALALGTLVGVVLAYCLVLAFDRSSGRLATLDMMNVITPTLAAILCTTAAGRSQTLRVRLFWLLMGAGMFFSALAEATWAVYEVFLGVETPYPSLADVFWLAAYPLQFSAVLALLSFRHRERLVAVSAVLDALLFALAAGALTWRFLMMPALDAAVPALENAVSIAYPAGDILILAAIGSMALIPRRSSLPEGLRWVAASLAVMVFADVVFSVISILGAYETGSWVDAFWPLGYALMGWAAVRHLYRVPTVGRPKQALWREVFSERARLALPYIALPVAGLLLATSLTSEEGNPPSLVAGSAVASLILIAFVLARQFVTVLENRRLQASLRAFSSELEQRVEERTEQLRVEKENLGFLNEVAAAMSHCTTSKQVTDTGLRLAQRALRCDSAGLWLRPPGAQPKFFGSRGLRREARMQLLAAARGSREAGDQTTPGVVMPDVADPIERRGPYTGVMVLPMVSRHNDLGSLVVPFEPNGDEEPPLMLGAAIAAEIAVAFENTRRFEEARYLAERDPVTGLLNHRGMNTRIEQTIACAQKCGSRFSLVMMDIDDFKLFNDTFGHAVGDEVLRDVSRVIVNATRKSDTVARYGGDEFLAILPDADAAEAVKLVHRIRTAVRSCGHRPSQEGEVPVLLSYGIAAYPEQGESIGEMLSAADAYLYRSKQKGGDAVSASTTETTDGMQCPGSFDVLDGLVTTVDNKDHYTRKHSDDVCARSLTLAASIGLSDDTQRALRIAALLHDVGKIGVPDHVLRKPSTLTMTELEAVRQHVNLGRLIVKELPDLNEVLEAIASHHERWDGGGYPKGLKGEEIPLLGRILAVTDAYSAMTTDRPYRKARTAAQAAEELRSVAGSQLDPALVKSFLALLGENRDPQDFVVAGMRG